MPIYEYSCGACGHHLEAIQKMTEELLTECPECHKPKLTKLVSAAGFQLKGTGWYATDFKNKGKPEVKDSTGKDNTDNKTTDTGSTKNNESDSKSKTTHTEAKDN
jgi:putative FmdB family regulatory protein